MTTDYAEIEKLGDLLSRYVAQLGYKVIRAVQYDIDKPIADMPNLTKWKVYCRVPEQFDGLAAAMDSMTIVMSLKTYWHYTASGDQPIVREIKTGKRVLIFDFWLNPDKAAKS
jgi:hypothetical protein